MVGIRREPGNPKPLFANAVVGKTQKDHIQGTQNIDGERASLARLDLEKQVITLLGPLQNKGQPKVKRSAVSN